MYDSDVIIVGAGLTGLRAAIELVNSGASVLLIEQSSGVGGRVKTLEHQGCLLDQGFQVIHSAYPELKLLPSLSSLALKNFTPGARIYFTDDSPASRIFNPLHRPFRGSLSLLTSEFAISDLLKCAPILLPRFRKPPKQQGVTLSQLLRDKKFTERFLSCFLRPMLRGVLLDESLHTDIGIALFYAHIIARGKASLPAKGMQALPDLLASTLGSHHILLNTRAIRISPHSVELDSGEHLSARKILCATEGLGAATLGGPCQTSPYNGTATLYFRASTPPFSEPLLALSGDGLGPINNLAILTNVQPSYTSDSSTLISASIVGRSATMPTDTLVQEARRQLKTWFGHSTHHWEFIRDFRIPDATPSRPFCDDGWLEKEGLYYAGDYLAYGSQNGALQAGRCVAQEILRNLF